MKLELARAGVFGEEGTRVTPEVLQEVAETFEGEAPVVIGHSLADYMPAFGWVKSVEYDPSTQTLYGEVELSELIRDAYEQGLYRKWSVGIRRRASDGRAYLHHLALLGGVPPKIKDLKVVNMADEEETEVWEFEMADSPPALSSLEIVDRPWDVEEARRRVYNRYGIEGLRAYSLWRDPEADPETKGAYKFLVVDIVDGEPKIIARALSAALAYLHGARGVKIPEEVRRVVEPKLKRLLKKKEKEENMADFKSGVSGQGPQSGVRSQESGDLELSERLEMAEQKLQAMQEALKKQKLEALRQAVEGKVPKAAQGMVFELADELSLEERVELSDGQDKRKLSPLDLLIEIFRALPMPVSPGMMQMSDSGSEGEINYTEILEKV